VAADVVSATRSGARWWLWLASSLTAAVASALLSSCSLFGPPPDFGPGSPLPPYTSRQDEINAARDRAIVALLGCAKQYATDNAGAIAAAGEIADASISHCGLELQAIDIANREGGRHINEVARLAYGSGVSGVEVERRVEQMHEDAVRIARGVALETVIGLRNPGK
jgi:hypothetical protein